MNPIYLDNAATTPLDPDVAKHMQEALESLFGNPSSIYSPGREARLKVEEARKLVAKHLNAKPSEIFFTSGGTESTNTALFGAVRDLGCQHIISSPIEHHATLHCIDALVKYHKVTAHWVQHDENGQVDLTHLNELLISLKGPVCVSLMLANNETGHMLAFENVATICEKHQAYFHSDIVQAAGHFPIDLAESKIHFASISAHKFHGPKGVGVLYVRSGTKIEPLIFGGAQERNMRAGTENTIGIIGLSKALDLACTRMESDETHMKNLRSYVLEHLIKTLPELSINSPQEEPYLYTVLNISLPSNDRTAMLQMQLDMKGIYVSGGSACSSGAAGGSHVINALRKDSNVPLRISFSKFNTLEQMDVFLNTFRELVLN